MIVDAHHHLWHYEPAHQPWLASQEAMAPLRRDFLGEEFEALLGACSIEKTVIVQAADSLEDSAFMLEAARKWDFIAGIVGWMPLDDPRAAEKALDVYDAEPKVKGFRHLFLWESDPDWLIRPQVVESLALLADRGYSWDSTAATARHLDHVGVVAEKIPNLMHVIDHLGKPPVSQGAWEPWASLMKRASQCPNVYVKLSGVLTASSAGSGSSASLQPYVEHVLEHFGPTRVMMASNWPVSNLFADYATTWRKTRAFIDMLPARERAAVTGGTAARFYKLE